jgi:fructose/tagatose bisphosphate aldolase
MATASTTNIERARALMRRSRREHFAVGAFNVDNQETLLAIVRAAQAKEAPVLVEVSRDEVSMIGLAKHTLDGRQLPRRIRRRDVHQP